MARFARILDAAKSLERVLRLGERWLERQAGAPPDPDIVGRFTAFRWDARFGPGRLSPIAEPQAVDLDDLIGVERSVSELVRNTEQFVRGVPAHHALLYGERGTGKSSSVKGLLTRFACRGLRLIEVHKSDLIQLPDVLAALHGLPHHFLLFCDDLSFDEGEAGLRELKAALDGSVEATPANVRIVATSNRRHLVAERVGENRAARLDDAGELHLSEAAEEKLALADRFGLMLPFFGFDQATYLRIVERHAAKAGLDVPRERLHGEALRFALRRGTRSGRTARHFVDDLAGRLALEAAAD